MKQLSPERFKELDEYFKLHPEELNAPSAAPAPSPVSDNTITGSSGTAPIPTMQQPEKTDNITPQNRPATLQLTPERFKEIDDYFKRYPEELNPLPKPAEPTTTEKVRETLRPGVRAVASTAVGTLGTAGDLAQTVVKPFVEGLLPHPKQFGGAGAKITNPIMESLFGSSASNDLRSTIEQGTGGLTTPRNEFERIVDKASEFAAGGGALKGVTAIAKPVELLAAKNLKELLSFAGAGAGGQAAKEKYPDNFAAELAGNLAGGAAPFAGKSLVKVLDQTQPMISKLLKINPESAKAINDVGIKPTLAAISDSPVVKTAQNAASRLPGSSGVISNDITKTTEEITKKLNNLGLEKAVTPQQAGEVIQSGVITGIERGKDKMGKFYKIFESKLPPKTQIETNNAQNALGKLMSMSDDANIQSGINSSQGARILKEVIDSAERNSIKDLATGKVTKGKINYEDLKRYRSEVGSLMKDVGKGKISTGEQAYLDTAYAALSDDMRTAAEAAGPKALRAFDKSNEMYNQFINTAKNNLVKVQRENAPEKIYQSLKQGTKIGGTKADAIMSQLNQEQRRITRGSIWQEMGGGAEDFNPVKAITAFEKLSPEARRALMKGEPASMINSYNKLAKAVKSLKSVDQYGNPSGSGYIANLGMFLGGSAFGGLTGLKGAATAYGVANISARLLNSKKFIDWLGQTGKISKNPKAIKSHINKLSAISLNNPELKNDIDKYISSLPKND
jgi:hypothetical protein